MKYIKASICSILPLIEVVRDFTHTDDLFTDWKTQAKQLKKRFDPTSPHYDFFKNVDKRKEKLHG